MSISQEEHGRAVAEALEQLALAGIVLKGVEQRTMEVADFGLGRLKEYGLAIVVYVNTPRVCAKELIMSPGQICPEHTHPWVSEANPGKEETFRCRWGEVYLYVEGKQTEGVLQAKVPKGDQKHLTARREIILRPGDQYTLPPNTRHWFQAGPDGAVVSEFSTQSTDELDIFTDPRIKRKPEIKS